MRPSLRVLALNSPSPRRAERDLFGDSAQDVRGRLACIGRTFTPTLKNRVRVRAAEGRGAGCPLDW